MTVVTATLLAAFFMQVGFLLWKIASGKLPPIESTRPLKLIRAFITSRHWVAGWVATTIGWVLFIRATDIGAISLVQPLMSVGDVFLVVMSVVFLGERLIRREWLGIALVILGAVILTMHVYPIQYESLDWPRIVLFYAAASLLALLAFLLTRRKPHHAEVGLAVVAGLLCGIGSSLTKLMTAYLALRGVETTTLDFVLNPIFPVMVAANVAGLVIVQMAFQKGRASVIVPIDLAVINLNVFAAGLFLFHETITVYHAVALAIITLGVFFLRPGDKNAKTPR